MGHTLLIMKGYIKELPLQPSIGVAGRNPQATFSSRDRALDLLGLKLTRQYLCNLYRLSHD